MNQSLTRLSLASLLGVLGIFGVTPLMVDAQTSLRESLERLDLNENNYIEPNELTARARPYLERIARSGRMSFHEPQRIDRILEVARYHYAQQNGVSGRDVRPQGESTVRPFGPDEGEPVVPEFGLAEIKFPYTQDDLDFADRTMRSHDHNEDGFIDREEAEDNRWTHRNPFDDDYNQDDRLSRLELAQRYARRRLLDEASDELRQRDWRNRSVERYEREREWEREREERRNEERWARREGSDAWLTENLMQRFDTNENGRLEMEESERLEMPISQIDIDRDMEITREELFDYMLQRQAEVVPLDESLPGWFYELDENRDKQIQMTEFVTEWSEERIDEFNLYDLNRDGLITHDELAQSMASVGGSFFNDSAEILPPRTTIISEIEVTEDFAIRKIRLQISLTHSYLGQLEGYLTGPNGQRIDLFRGIGGSSDFLDDTIFDDDSENRIDRGRPPYRGTFLPHGRVEGKPGLSSYAGESVQGVWQLVIRGTRSERYGVLHNWGLIVEPVEE